MENRNLGNDNQSKKQPRAVRPVGVKPRNNTNGARPNRPRPIINNTSPYNNTNEQINTSPHVQQRRENIVDVDAENENYFINSMEYEDVIEDETTKSMDIDDERQKAKQKTPEQLKKRKTLMISCCSAGVIAIAGLVAVNVLKSDKGFSINKADITGHEPVYIEVEQIDCTVDTDNTQDTTENEVATTELQDTTEQVKTEHVDRIYTIIVPEVEQEYSKGSFITSEFKVETKPNGSDEFIVSDTKYNCGLEEIYTGDTVNDIIKQYNETNTSNKKISIDTESTTDSKFIVVRVGCDYPEDYPTSDGMAYEIPDVSIRVVGTYTEPVETTSETTATEENKQSGQGINEYTDKLEADGKIYTLNEPVILHDVPKSIDIAQGYNFDYLVQMPKGAEGDGYKIIATINGQEIVYKGVDID